MYAERHEVALTTDASGDAEGYTPHITGRIVNVIYQKTDFADGVDFDVTLEATGQVLWDEDDVNTAKTVAPRQPTHAPDGSASLYAGSGEPVETDIIAANDRVKIVVAQGGDTKTGTFIVIVG